MHEIVAELDFEEVILGWLIRPVFSVDRDSPDDRPTVTIHLFHTACLKTGKVPQHCGLVNRDEFKAGAFPEYECNSCAQAAPSNVIEEKLLAAGRYKGYDPRNNRRAAVLATKNKGTKNVRN
jgi:hypothetical protein